MSADNGIYILETNGQIVEDMKEYRVIEAQAIENIEYDKNAPDPMALRPNYEGGEYHSVYEYRPDDAAHTAYREAYRKKYHSSDPDVLIANAREYWGKAVVFYKKEDALAYAAVMEQKIEELGYPLEYGISFIRIPRIF